MAGEAAEVIPAASVTVPAPVFTDDTVVDPLIAEEVTCIPLVMFASHGWENAIDALPATIAVVGFDRPTSSDDGFTQST